MIAWIKSVLRKFGLGRHPTDDIDPELLGVFFDELQDITLTLERAFAIWRINAADERSLKNLRRGFHTIKSSARLVGAADLGEFSRQFELLAIRLLEQRTKVSPTILVSFDQAIALLPVFARSMRDHKAPPPQTYVLCKRVERL